MAYSAYISAVVKDAGRKGVSLPALRHSCEQNIAHFKKGLFTISLHHMLENDTLHRVPHHFNTFRMGPVGGKAKTGRVRTMAGRKAEIAKGAAAKASGKKTGGKATTRKAGGGGKARSKAAREHKAMMEGEGEQQHAAHMDEPMTDVEGK